MELKKVIDRGKEVLIIPDGIAVIGKECNIVVFNEAASRITGFPEDEIVGENCGILFEENSDGMNFLKESIRDNRAFTNLAFNIKTKKESEKNVLASITPIVRNENVVSSVLVFRDTKEMLSLAEDLEEKTTELLNQKNKLDAIFNSNIEGIFTIDDDWNVTSFNAAAEKITGYKINEAIGKKCWQIFNSQICCNGCHMEQTMKNGKPTIANELEIINKFGNRIPIRVNSAILKNNKNEKIGAVETFLDISEIKNLTEHLNERFKYENIVGKNKEIKQIINVLESVAQTDSSVLITGESGTGKELAARAIHLNSHRRTGPFTAVNCSAFVESLIESELFGHEKGSFTGAIKSKVGRFELANGGTLFLDEIGDLSVTVQTKLLRVLETREIERVGSNKPIKIDTRIIAATNKNLEREIEAGRFREDLYYRINVMNIQLPPLRERKDDLPILVNHFIEKFNSKFERNIKHFSSSAFDILMDYNWPGNIRELENVIEHCFVLCDSDIIQIEHLPKRLRDGEFNTIQGGGTNNFNHIKDAERNIIIKTLKKHNGNRTKTAEELNIHPTTLWRKMKKFNLLEGMES
ncbi:MAG: sigma 54-interacting transcriptional regulator [Melioribacteraceae bacterium]|nr:sigma 54-interacting transcriptional regulator [Melioribacteraceae bacterium]